MPADTGTIIVFTNLPDRDSALALAKHLVEERFAACVNVLDGCTSVFRWQSTLQTEREVPVIIKTRRDRFAALQEAIRTRHPYEVPEIVAVPVTDGLAEYLYWISTETQC
jgi:periplasmic divalent cation tolerance protein